MKDHCARISAVVLVVALSACTSTSEHTESTVSVELPATSIASASPSETAEAFPTEVFASLGDEPVSDDVGG